MAQYKSSYTGPQIDAAIDTVYNLADVATSGDYDDLINKPSIPSNIVTSVNNKTGDVTLTASDVGAMPSSYTAPVTSVNGQTGVVSLTIPSAVTNSYRVDSNSGKVMLYTSTNSSSTVTQTKTSGALDFSISGGGDATLQIGKSSTDEGTRGLIKISNHANANYTTIDAPAWAATEIHLPSSSGTLALTSEIPSVSVTDVQINGTSILNNKVANLVTNTAYDASSNKIATMSDLPTVPSNVSSFTNDAGYLTLATLPIYNGEVS